MKKPKGSARASMKKKHTLVIASLSLVVLTIGCTIAYNQNQMFLRIYSTYNRDGRIQPLVSLKEGTTYTSGDGTRTNPWVIGQ